MEASVPSGEQESGTSRIAAERSLYRALLELAERDDVEAFLPEALALLCTASGARRGYLEIADPAAGGAVRYWTAYGLDGDEIGAVRSQLSRGILADALASGRTLQTASAWNDPRFRERRSVQQLRIEAVLCVPLGANPGFGVACLQERSAAGPFSADDVARAEFAARSIARCADRILLKLRMDPSADATASARRSFPAETLVGRSPALACALRDAAVVLRRDVNVLITGETGTGKSELARLLWRHGPRARGPIVELNCAAIPPQLAEQELFGSVAGAHSAALQRIPGKVGAADGGVLFLDEIGELPAETQAKLLQLVEQRTYYPLGGTQPERADVQIIAATNSDLDAAVRARRFRADLYWRLATFPIRMPSLAERPDDIPLIAGSLAARLGERHGVPSMRLSPAALTAIRAAPWPGNVRELAGRIEAGLLRAVHQDAREIGVRHVFPEAGRPADDDDADVSGASDRACGAAGAASAAPGPTSPAAPQVSPAQTTAPAARVDPTPSRAESVTWQDATSAFQRRLLEETLAACGGNVTEAARRLGLARSHLYTLLETHGLRRG